MNAKRCKLLRREARARSVGQQWCAYQILERIRQKGKRMRVVRRVLVLHPKCGRAAYQRLKRDMW